MEFYDVVDFSFEEYKSYGFSKVYEIGKNIFEYAEPLKKTLKPAIFATENPDIARRYLKFFDIIYLKNYDTNIALIRAVAQKKKFFLASIGDLLKEEGTKRALLLYRISRFLRFCLSYKAHFVLATRANDIYGVRSPYEIEMIGELLGLSRDQTRFALTTLGWLK